MPSRDGSVTRRTQEGERKLKEAEEELASLRTQLSGENIVCECMGGGRERGMERER